MKKIPVLLTIITLFGCNANTKSSKTSDSLISDSVVTDTVTKISMADSAKMMLDSANFYMVKGIKKELSKDETNKKLTPYMNSFERIYKKLSPTDTTIVYQYRIDGLNKLIDLQIEQSKK